MAKKKGEQDLGEKSRFMARAEESAHQKALVERAIEARKMKLRKVKAALDTVLKSDAGRTLFTHLFEACSYNRSSVAVDMKTGDYQPLASAFNDGRRSVYINLRDSELGTPTLMIGGLAYAGFLIGLHHLGAL